MPDGGPPGIWRAAFPADADLPDDALLDAERIEQRMQRLVPRAQRYEIRYKSIYRVHQRVAKTFREGRVLHRRRRRASQQSARRLRVEQRHSRRRSTWPTSSGACGAARRTRCSTSMCASAASATVEQVQAMSIRNKRLLEERDPAVQREHLGELVALAEDPERARKYLLDSSMISGLRRSLQVQ